MDALAVTHIKWKSWNNATWVNFNSLTLIKRTFSFSVLFLKREHLVKLYFFFSVFCNTEIYRWFFKNKSRKSGKKKLCYVTWICFKKFFFSLNSFPVMNVWKPSNSYETPSKYFYSFLNFPFLKSAQALLSDVHFTAHGVVNHPVCLWMSLTDLCLNFMTKHEVLTSVVLQKKICYYYIN